MTSLGEVFPPILLKSQYIVYTSPPHILEALSLGSGGSEEGYRRSMLQKLLLKDQTGQSVIECIKIINIKDVVNISAAASDDIPALKIFKPHSQISRLGMWTICFPIYNEGLLIGLFFEEIL